MKQLGVLTLPESLQWTDRDAWSPVIQSTATTLGGGTAVFSQSRLDGRPITLEAEDQVTWLDRTTIDALKEMAVQAGAIFPLIWEGKTYSVMFRHHDAPAISFQPLWPHHDLFTGTIKLMEI